MSEDQQKSQKKSRKSRCLSNGRDEELLQKTCLKQQYSLRIQLLLSFGLVSAIAIIVMMSVSLVICFTTDNHVNSKARSNLEMQAKNHLGAMSRQVAEMLSSKMDNFDGLSSLLTEMVRDRFVGYPDHPGYSDDSLVPFVDSLTGRNRYPLNASSALRSDWNMEANVNSENYREHVQGRLSYYGHTHMLSTANAIYRVQGACDPSVTNSSDNRYYPNCTEANNDLATGGVVRPTPTNAQIARKSADLSFVLKAIYENHQDVRNLGVHFANAGAGSTLAFPGMEINGLSNYTSIGCEWMRQRNPLTGKPLASQEEINRCHKEGDVIPAREYNGLEREWCSDQAMNLGKSRSVGPYRDAFVNNLWLMTFGRAVHDRVTNEFIACTLVDVPIDHFAKDIEDVINMGPMSQIAIVRWHDGTVVVSSAWDSKSCDKVVTIYDLDEMGVDESMFESMKSQFDFTQKWNPQHVRDFYDKKFFSSHDRLITSSPMPVPPETYDSEYHPEFLIIMTNEQVFQKVKSLEDEIRNNSLKQTWYTLIVGCSGLAAVIIVIYLLTFFLTKPIKWMGTIGNQVVDNFGHHDPMTHDVDFNKVFCFSPKTEITALAKAFEKTLLGFSGKGTAKTVQEEYTEVKNPFDLFDEFKDLYERRHENGFEFSYITPSATALETTTPLDYRGIFTSNQTAPPESANKPDLDHAILSDDVAAKEVPGALENRDTIHSEKCDSTGNHAAATSTSVTLRCNETGSTEEECNSGNCVAAATCSKTLCDDDSIPFEEGFNEDFIERNYMSRASSRCHVERNIRKTIPRVDVGSKKTFSEKEVKQILSGYRATSSPTFWWIFASNVTTLMATIIIIGTMLIFNSTLQTQKYLDDVKSVYVTLERESVDTTTKLRSMYASRVMNKPVRDISILSRAAGWLFFGGLQRTDSFTNMFSNVEACKNGTCDELLGDKIRAPCDCDWLDGYGVECTNYNFTDSRYLQTQFYSVQNDAWPNGDRNFTSFPNSSYSAGTTSWWDDVRELPGSHKGSAASGYATTYDRLRVMSALSSVSIPLYNYLRTRNTVGGNLGNFIGFEADGMFVGYPGCDHSVNLMSQWSSNENNGAFLLEPNLCPMNKYGYDSRCRDWYVNGKKRSKGSGSPLYVTPPYLFAGASGTRAQSLTLPLVDPETGMHVGQTLQDYFPGPIIDSLQVKRTAIGPGVRGFPILITSQPDAFGSDTIVGPNFSLDDEGVPIGDLVLPDDCGIDDDKFGCSSNRQNFENILKDMRDGKQDTAHFTRTTSDGTEEEVYIAYAPVSATTFRPMNDSDFSRGVNSSEELIYSLGIVIPEPELFRPFVEIKDDLDKVFITCGALLITLMIVLIAVIVWITSRVAMTLTVPIILLLRIVEKVNSGNIFENIPRLEGGSKEVSLVYGAFEKLYMVVRISNTAILSGDLDSAHKVLVDALATFTQLGNKKAIAIANNNLGSVMLTMYRTIQSDGTSNICGMSKEDIISAGREYFDNAIESGEEDLDRIHEEEGWTKGCLVFMQQLSNRYFNRAMFFLTVHKDNPGCFNEASKDMGYRDLKVAKDMDSEVMEHRIQEGLTGAEDEHFDLLLGRINGLLTLLRMNYNDLWGVEEFFEDIMKMLSSALTNPNHDDLFSKIGPAGRMQQIDAALIKFMEINENYDDAAAAKIGIRMLVEDEYVLPEEALKAIRALMNYIEHNEANTFSDLEFTLIDYQTALLVNIDPKLKETKGRRKSLTLEEF